MERRWWPDVVIVVAVLALGAGGVWALWGDALREPKRAAPAAAPPTATSPAAPMT